MDNANRLFQKRFCFSQIGAGKAVMLTYLVCVFVSPFIGVAVDKLGRRRYFIVGTTVVYLLAQFIFLVYPSCVVDTEKGAISGLVLIGILKFKIRYWICIIFELFSPCYTNYSQTFNYRNSFWINGYDLINRSINVSIDIFSFSRESR